MKLFFALTLFTAAAMASGAEFHEIDAEKANLVELGQFAARQMSTKSSYFKMMQVQHAEQADSRYKLRLALQRNGDKNDLMYCTVEIETKPSELSLENYGCTLPALVRRRRPQAPKVEEVSAPEAVPSAPAPVPSNDDYDILSYPYDKAINAVKTQVNDEDESTLNEIDSEPTRKPKRHIMYVHRQPIRVAIPARSYYYQPSYSAVHSRPLYQIASQPIVYRLQPQYHTQYQPHYYQPYYRTIAY